MQPKCDTKEVLFEHHCEVQSHYHLILVQTYSLFSQTLLAILLQKYPIMERMIIEMYRNCIKVKLSLHIYGRKPFQKTLKKSSEML